MKLKIQDFGVNQHTDNFDLNIDSMEEIKISEPVKVTIKTVTRDEIGVGKIYTISGHYSANIEIQCVRCLKNIAQNISGEFQWNFLETKDYQLYINSLKNESELSAQDFEEALDGEIDISDLVRQQIILDVGDYPVCENQCEDDSEIKKYTETSIDSRWAKLLEIE